ncbi:MAG: hypothetical protein AB4042_16480 [Leptolyngbyaceae cyanobacterium]
MKSDRPVSELPLQAIAIQQCQKKSDRYTWARKPLPYKGLGQCRGQVS